MTADPHRLERLPTSPDERAIEGRAARSEVVDFFADRFAIPTETWDEYTFWEKGADTVWAYAGSLDGPIDVETLGMRVLRTGGRHWKPTTDAVQRFGRFAGRNVIEVDAAGARAFLAGEDRPVDWGGDWGYLIVAHEIADDIEPIGVGLYTHGELSSMVPKGRRRELEPTPED